MGSERPDLIPVDALDCPPAWLVGPKSRLIDTFSPQLMPIRLAGIEKDPGSWEVVFHDRYLSEAKYLSRWKRNRGMPIHVPGVYLDARHDSNCNIAHAVFLTAVEAACVEHVLANNTDATPRSNCLVVVREAAAPYCIEAIKMLGFEVLATDRPVVGTCAIWQPYGNAIHWRLFLDALRGKASLLPPRPELGKKLFINRRGVRSIVNGQEVKEHLSAKGFTEVFMEDHSVADQLAMLRGVTDVVALHGAGLAPLALVDPVSSNLEFRLVELFGALNVTCYREVVGLLGGRWVGVLGELDYQVHRDWQLGKEPRLHQKDSFSIDLEGLDLALQIAESASGELPSDFVRKFSD